MATPPTPTLTHVAAKAGVSVSTASLALRSDPRITAATQLRVRRAAKAVGYRPDPLLAALVARRSGTKVRRTFANIVAIVDDRWPGLPDLPWLNEMISGIKSACEQLGYAISVLHLGHEMGPARQADRVLYNRGVQGVVILPLVDHRVELPFTWTRYASVFIGNPPAGLSLHRVGSDAFKAMQMTRDRLEKMGYRKIGYANSLIAERRLRFEWLGAFGPDFLLGNSPAGIVRPYMPEEMIEAGFLTWLAEQRPDVVVCNDARILHWLEANHIAVPTQIGVALLNRDFSGGKVAGISQHLFVAGAAAVEQLHGMLLRGQRGIPDVQREVLIAPKWVDGPTLRVQPRD